MGRKRFTAEQIIRKLREAEVLTAKGQTVRQVCQHLGVTDQTYYRGVVLGVCASWAALLLFLAPTPQPW